LKLIHNYLLICALVSEYLLVNIICEEKLTRDVDYEMFDPFSNKMCNRLALKLVQI